MKFSQSDNLYAVLSSRYRMDETSLVNDYLDQYDAFHLDQSKIQKLAYELVAKVRSERSDQSMLDAFLAEYDLSSQEGVALMCLAEALLRVPDVTTINRLIEDKLGTLEAGKFADIVAVKGNPLEDITTLENVQFVMKGGKIYKQ